MIGMVECDKDTRYIQQVYGVPCELASLSDNYQVKAVFMSVMGRGGDLVRDEAYATAGWTWEIAREGV
jgi:hypothetical protein